MVKSIQLNSKDDVIRLNKVACSKDYNIGISHKFSTLDAKSILLLFTLIGKQDLLLVLPDHISPNEAFKTLKQMKLADC